MPHDVSQRRDSRPAAGLANCRRGFSMLQITCFRLISIAPSHPPIGGPRPGNSKSHVIGSLCIQVVVTFPGLSRQQTTQFFRNFQSGKCCFQVSRRPCPLRSRALAPPRFLGHALSCTYAREKAKGHHVPDVLPCCGPKSLGTSGVRVVEWRWPYDGSNTGLPCLDLKSSENCHRRCTTCASPLFDL